MSYNEIMQAIQQGKKVYWYNKGYEVSIAQNALYITYKYNGYFSRLQKTEVKNCFIHEA